MAKSFSSEWDTILFSKGKVNENNSGDDTVGKKNFHNNSQSNRFIKCYRYEKPGHIKRNCRTRLSGAHVAYEDDNGDQLNWEQCFTTEVAGESKIITLESTLAQTSINYANCKDEWIIDSHIMSCMMTLYS
ncbi:hypothetical protein V6N12_024259 [Hibiscus sabdariffa]|uniref:Uncharacterized protein n=1 Tax=Hibiscus sabdariffa TaxID=183260 RepID=A0ABR2G015_9ROSI